ncbi:MAG: 50S ribosomal protein L13, partial [Gemmataceae bacterium]|nr:50S ribosomal protein L13 [Gemmataceae bacterium]
GAAAHGECIMPTYMAKPGEVPRNWHLIDATDQVVGRLAVRIANILRGKHRPQYTPHVDTGDFVIVVNAAKVKFTGRKLEQKTYQRYSHYPGGLKIIPAKTLLEKHPERILENAVRRMVPRNKLGRAQLAKLKIYAGPDHPHQAQQPKELKLS